MRSRRLAGSAIDRSRRLGFRFDGRSLYGHPGDTLAYEIFHEVAATWSGAECGVEFRSTTLF
jgi:hypothetical protein